MGDMGIPLDENLCQATWKATCISLKNASFILVSLTLVCAEQDGSREGKWLSSVVQAGIFHSSSAVITDVFKFHALLV